MALTLVRNRGTTGIETDLQPIKSDLSALALREATNESSSAFNLPNQFIDTFTDDTNLGTQTQVDRASGYISSHYLTTGAFPNDSNTIMLLHLDNNVTDSSSNSITVTNNGSLTFSTSVKKFGTHGLVFSGSSQWLSTPDIEGVDNSVVAPSTGDYTFEGWFKYYNTHSNNYTDRLFSIGNDGTPSSGGTPMLSYGYSSSGTSNNINFWGSVGSVNHNFNAPAQDTDWHHHAIMRVSGTTYTFIDGIRRDSTTNFDDSTFLHDGTIFIGARSSSTSEYFYGYADEIRYSNIARYSTSGSTGDTIFTPNEIEGTYATGTLIQSANTVSSAKTKVGGTILYKDSSGTATIGTDLKVYFSCNGGSNWTEATSYNAITPVYSTGIKQVRLGQTTCTSGTDVRYKVEWANQSNGSKVTQLHGIGINY